MKQALTQHKDTKFASNSEREIIFEKPDKLITYALSPRYHSEQVLGMLGRVAPYADEEVANGCYKAFTRLFLDDEMHDAVRQEFGLFALGLKMSPFAIKDQYKMGAITWWYMYGQPYKHLQDLAIKILSQVASSSTTERNWSTYSYIHSVKRNRLGSKKAEDLVTFIPTCVFCHVTRMNTSVMPKIRAKHTTFFFVVNCKVAN